MMQHYVLIDALLSAFGCSAMLPGLPHCVVSCRVAVLQTHLCYVGVFRNVFCAMNSAQGQCSTARFQIFGGDVSNDGTDGLMNMCDVFQALAVLMRLVVSRLITWRRVWS